MRVGIAGLGAIGRTVARALHQGTIPKMELAGVAVRDTAKAQSFLKEIGCNAPILSMAQLAAAE